MKSSLNTATVSKFEAWKLAIRPKTLPAAISPVFVGSALAYRDQGFNAIVAFFALIGALLLQILSNLTNDYYDFLKGIDTEERKGPLRVMQAGLLSKKEMQWGIFINILLAGLVGLYLIYIGGLPILLIGLFSIIFAILYSGGPYPLSSLGLGDLFVFIFFGLVAVPGTYFVLSGGLTYLAFIVAIPPGVLITGILVVNNYRDLDTDKKANKRTLAQVLGKGGTQIYYATLLGVAYLVPVYLFFIHSFSLYIFLCWATLPLAWALVKTIFTSENPATLNNALAGTAKLSLMYCVLFAIGIVI